jgi:transcriptional regulator with XRE-family HTH domain
VNDIVVGRVIRALRRRRGWRQLDLANRSGVSQRHISTIERGHLDGSSLRTIRKLGAALEVRVELTPSWRGAELDRLLDAEHARLVAATARRLEAVGWLIRLEVTYSEYGERGSIDVLGLRPGERACLVVEVKSTIASAEATGRKLDEKARLAPGIVLRREGWRPEVVGRVLVVPETSSLRRLMTGSSALAHMLPIDAAAVRAWLRRPIGTDAATWFLSGSNGTAARRGSTTRIRRPAARSSVIKAHPRPSSAAGSTGGSP